MSSAKRPPQQQHLSPMEIPYLLPFIKKMSLMNKLKLKLMRGRQPWQIPFLVLNDSDNYPSILYTSRGG